MFDLVHCALFESISIRPSSRNMLSIFQVRWHVMDGGDAGRIGQDARELLLGPSLPVSSTDQISAGRMRRRFSGDDRTVRTSVVVAAGLPSVVGACLPIGDPLGDPCAHGPPGFTVMYLDRRSHFRSPPEPPASKAAPAPRNRTVRMWPFCNGVSH